MCSYSVQTLLWKKIRCEHQKHPARILLRQAKSRCVQPAADSDSPGYFLTCHKACYKSHDLQAVIKDITSMAETPELCLLPDLILHLSTQLQFRLFTPALEAFPGRYVPGPGSSQSTEQSAVEHTLCTAYSAILLLSMSWRLLVSDKIQSMHQSLLIYFCQWLRPQNGTIRLFILQSTLQWTV